MKVYSNPERLFRLPGEVGQGDYVLRKEWTFGETITGKGVKVTESDKLLGTGWLYIEKELKLN